LSKGNFQCSLSIGAILDWNRTISEEEFYDLSERKRGVLPNYFWVRIRTGSGIERTQLLQRGQRISKTLRRRLGGHTDFKDNEDPSIFGTRLRSARLARRWSVDKLSDRIRFKNEKEGLTLSPKAIKLLEKGTSTPRQKTLKLLFSALPELNTPA